MRALPIVSATLLLTACAASTEPITVSGIAFRSMQWQVKVAHLPRGLSATELRKLLQARLDAANDVLSTYQRDTELMRFNRAPVGTWVAVSPHLLRALVVTRTVSQATDGAYDVTVGPLVDLWGFGPRGKREGPPTHEEIRAARARVGWRFVEVDPARARARRLRDVSIDLSSVGEGIGVEVLAGALEERSIHDSLVQIAGVLRAAGRKADAGPWRLAIERPDGSGAPQRLLVLAEGVLSTSGSYRNYFEHNGIRYSHTIDPGTGRPITHRGVLVSVVFPQKERAAEADAWATALNVLGPDRGLALAERRGLAAYFIEKADSGFRARHTTAFAPFLGEELGARK